MSKKIGSWTQLESKIAYENPWIKVREDKVLRPDGKLGLYGVVITPPSVIIVAVNETNQFYLLKQFRYPTERYSWEVPAGSTDNEEPLLAAQRELAEETNMKAETWTKLAVIQTNNGVCSELANIFLAQELTPTNQHNSKVLEEGIEEFKYVSFKEIITMVNTAELTDSRSITAIFHAALKLHLIS